MIVVCFNIQVWYFWPTHLSAVSPHGRAGSGQVPAVSHRRCRLSRNRASRASGVAVAYWFHRVFFAALCEELSEVDFVGIRERCQREYGDLSGSNLRKPRRYTVEEKTERRRGDWRPKKDVPSERSESLNTSGGVRFGHSSLACSVVKRNLCLDVIPQRHIIGNGALGVKARKKL